MRFHKNAFPQKYFPRIAFHEMQENQNGGKSRKPRLIIIYVGHIKPQQLLENSAEYLTNNTGV